MRSVKCRIYSTTPKGPPSHESVPPPLKVVWITDFPIEWLPDIPDTLKGLPRMHARSWQQVLLREFESNSALRLHIIILRKGLSRNVLFQRNGVTFHVLRIPAAVREQTLYWADTFLVKRTLAGLQPDVVHAWGTERGAHLVAKRLGYPYLVTIQGLVTWYAELIPLNVYERFAAFLEKWQLAAAPLVTTESSFAVDYLTRKFPGLSVWQAEHAPNKVFHQVRRAPQTEPLRFLFVGYLGFRKGADLLLSALEAVRPEISFELVVIGDVEPRFQPLLQALSERPGVKLETYRNLSAPQIAQELSKATMMLFPTRADTSPNAVKEAVVAGVPVVASGIGGIIDYVIPGKNGFTFPSEDIPAFVQRLREACQHPLFAQGSVEEETLRRMRAYLAPEKMAERFLQAYEILAGRRTLPPMPARMFP